MRTRTAQETQSGASSKIVAKEPSRIPALVLFALFMATLLIAIVMGVSVYSNIAHEREIADNSRFAHGLLVNNVRSVDSYGAVRIGQGPQGDALVFVQNVPAGTVETRFFQANGSIYLQTAMEGSEYAIDGSTKIMDSSTFDFSFNSGLLTIFTDDGPTEVALKSAAQGMWF